MQNKQQQQELVSGFRQLLFTEAKGKFGEENAEGLEFFDEVVGSSASKGTLSERNVNSQWNEIAGSSLNLPILQRFSCPFSYERNQQQGTTFR